MSLAQSVESASSSSSSSAGQAFRPDQNWPGRPGLAWPGERARPAMCHLPGCLQTLRHRSCHKLTACLPVQPSVHQSLSVCYLPLPSLSLSFSRSVCACRAVEFYMQRLPRLFPPPLPFLYIFTTSYMKLGFFYWQGGWSPPLLPAASAFWLRMQPNVTKTQTALHASGPEAVAVAVALAACTEEEEETVERRGESVLGVGI